MALSEDELSRIVKELAQSSEEEQRARTRTHESFVIFLKQLGLWDLAQKIANAVLSVIEVIKSLFR